jgi:hypothetical protein
MWENRWIVFAIDEYSRFVFVDFIKLKSDADAAIKRCIAAFNATVGTPIDEAGQPLLHHTTSPPHDHDLNPIAERIIGLISETAVAIKDSTDAPIRLWPWLIAYAVEWHNSTVSSVGSHAP